MAPTSEKKKLKRQTIVIPKIERVSSSSDEDDIGVLSIEKREAEELPAEEAEVSSSSDEDDIGVLSKEKREAEELPAEEAEFLRGLVIDLRHKVPPQHEIERRAGTRAFTAQQKEDFKKIVPRMKQGTFSSKEDRIIKDNWKAFCRTHGWTSCNPKPFLFHRHDYHYYIPKMEERKKFVQFLADGLPERTLYSVYHRFRNLYSPHKVMKYSLEEDNYILRHIEENVKLDESRKFADLAKVLNRTRASIWRRYRLLNKKRKMTEDSD